MIIGEKLDAGTAIPVTTRGGRGGGRFAAVVAQALKLDVGEKLPISFGPDDGKYPSNNLVHSIRKGTYAGMGLDAKSGTVDGAKTVYLIRL